MLKTILGKIHQADLDYQMIEDGDTVAVGVSGGKDSLLLLYALYRYRHFVQVHDHRDFRVIGIHLEMGFGNMDFEPVRSFMKKYDIPYYDEPTQIYDILKLYPEKNGGISCSRCSQLKKGAMIEAAKRYGATKTAFAHHGDDAVETLWMNMMFGGRLSTFEPKMYLTKSQMTFIRPLIYCYEDEIRDAAVNELQLPVVKSTCPNDGYTRRAEAKAFLNQLYNEYPTAHANCLKALHNKDQLKLFDISGKDQGNNE